MLDILNDGVKLLSYTTLIILKPVLQIRAGQWSITVNLRSLTAHICHVMIIMTIGFSKKSFFY